MLWKADRNRELDSSDGLCRVRRAALATECKDASHNSYAALGSCAFRRCNCYIELDKLYWSPVAVIPKLETLIGSESDLVRYDLAACVLRVHLSRLDPGNDLPQCFGYECL